MGAVPSPTPHVRDDATSSTASSRTYRLHRSGRAREGVAPGGKVHTCNNNDNTTPKSNTANQTPTITRTQTVHCRVSASLAGMCSNNTFLVPYTTYQLRGGR